MSSNQAEPEVRAIVFDMDGVLLNSEPLWRRAEVEVFSSVGVPMTLDMCDQTMGTRADEVVDYWFHRYPWSGESPARVEARLIDRVASLLQEHAANQAAPGLEVVLSYLESKAIPFSVASSSAFRLIETALRAIGVRHRFAAVHSAEIESHGKPHPAVYLSAAQAIGVAPEFCMAIEDSVMGLISAKAARMHCVVIPDPSVRGDRRLGLADAVLPSLEDIPKYLDTVLAKQKGALSSR
jgi:sugar-phosphatase